jgi:protein-L-isoaspartate O-methyltransferase
MGAGCDKSVSFRVFWRMPEVDFHRLFHESVEKWSVWACRHGSPVRVRSLEYDQREPMRKLFLTMAIGCVALSAQSGDADKLAPYYPTPETIVDKMLQLGGLKAGEKMYDLGSGDGRIVILAAQKFHAEAVGVEIDKDLCKQSTAKILKLGLDKNAHIVNGDLLKQNYSSADLVTVYLLPDAVNNKVQPLLDKQLKKGARIVAKDFDFHNWTAEKVENIADDGEGRSHTLYLYRK